MALKMSRSEQIKKRARARTKTYFWTFHDAQYHLTTGGKVSSKVLPKTGQTLKVSDRAKKIALNELHYSVDMFSMPLRAAIETVKKAIHKSVS
jgi:hypothetical protein